jgi:serine protease Do
MNLINLNGKLKKRIKLVLFLGVLAFIAGSIVSKISARTLQLPSGPPPVQLGSSNPALAVQQAFIDVATKVSPAVVNISSEWTENVPMNNFGSLNQFFNFWFNGGQGGQIPEYKQKEQALGSGFIITSSGYILTNNHVIGKAKRITVILQDGEHFKGTIIGKDPKTDIAVVKINAHKYLPHVVLGNSNNIQVGQWVIAIGNPFGLNHTVTSGVVSAKGRSIPISEDSTYQSYIQTDASINPGNSGGPLCNIEGEVIGINTAIYSQSGGSIGIGFAIPINVAKKVAEDLVDTGKVIRAGLGAIVQSLSYKMAKSFGLNTTEGALVSYVNPGSAAQKAGLKTGDIILKLDGIRIINSTDLVAELYTYNPGQHIILTIFRNGHIQKLHVTLEALTPGFEKKMKQQEEKTTTGGSNTIHNLGISYVNSSANHPLPAGAPKGPILTHVNPNGPAGQAGFKPGDVVIQANDQRVYTAAQLTRVLNKSNLKQGLRLLVWRNGITLYGFLQDN